MPAWVTRGAFVVVPSVGHRLKLISAVREVGSPESTAYLCTICKSMFDCFDNYWLHVKDFHELTGASPRVGCPLCKMPFTNLRTLRKHIVGRICSKSEAGEAGIVLDKVRKSPTNFYLLEGVSVPKVHHDHRLAFMKSLEMSGSIPFVKSAEILCAANSLVNDTLELAKREITSGGSMNQILIKLNLKNPFSNFTSSQTRVENGRALDSGSPDYFPDGSTTQLQR